MNWTDDAKRLAREACEAWRGTPHVHRRAIPGKGVDCVNLVVAILTAAGALEPVKRLPSYPTTWGLMSPENVLGRAFERACHVRRMKAADGLTFKFGDVVIFKAGRQSNHVGIVVDGLLWHVMTRGAVAPSSISRHRRGIQEVVRLIAPGWKVDPETLNLELLK